MVEIIKPIISNGKKKRVVAYCRVSTDKAEQINSFETQCEYYSKKINDEPDWEYVGIFYDLGITGTSIRKRQGFQEMMNQCMMGNVDMVITKSITRFARNKLECLQTIEDLRKHNVDIFFEKERIHTNSHDGGILISLLATLAENTSKNTSTNLKWSIKNRMESGLFRIKVPPYGYDIENGELIINLYEGAMVRFIFDEYLKGNGCRVIARKLSESNFYTRTGNKKWDSGFVHKVITNPVYAGDLLLQKTVTTSFPYRIIKNNGYADQYLYENDHEPIITREESEKVHSLLNRKRKEIKYFRNTSTHRVEYPYSNLMFCAECGSIFIRQQYQRKNGFRVCWKHKEFDNCNSKIIDELQIDKVVEKLIYIIKYDNKVLIREFQKQLFIYAETMNSSLIKKYKQRIEHAYQDFYESTQSLSRKNVNVSSYLKEEIVLKNTIDRCEKEINRIFINSEVGNLLRNTENLISLLDNDECDHKILVKKVVKRIEISNPCIFEIELINGMKIRLDGDIYDI